MSVIGAWNGQGSKCHLLTDVLKRIFCFVADYNVDLHLQYVPTLQNLADAPSRKLDISDAMLSEEGWLMLEETFGPNSTDLMSLDSNVMKSVVNGQPLRHFTPWVMPDSAGVNVFSQDLRKESNMYVYPPFVLIFPVLCLLEEQGVECTIVVPEMIPIPIWWPMLKKYSTASMRIGGKGQKGVIRIPSKKGFVLDETGLRWPLIAFRISFV